LRNQQNKAIQVSPRFQGNKILLKSIYMAAISVENLTKVFNGLRAVDGISFEVKEGELFGLLGPNGAGKTTTLNMLATLIRPTSGKDF
jgi:ABC-type multidrug transport system ATPase subunit